MKRNRRDLDGAALDQAASPSRCPSCRRARRRAGRRYGLTFSAMSPAGTRAFRRFDGGPRQDDAADLLFQQVRDRLRHRQVGLARSPRARRRRRCRTDRSSPGTALVDALRRDARRVTCLWPPFRK
jgi:hypothetical protein